MPMTREQRIERARKAGLKGIEAMRLKTPEERSEAAKRGAATRAANRAKKADYQARAQKRLVTQARNRNAKVTTISLNPSEGEPVEVLNAAPVMDASVEAIEARNQAIESVESILRDLEATGVLSPQLIGRIREANTRDCDKSYEAGLRAGRDSANLEEAYSRGLSDGMDYIIAEAQSVKAMGIPKS